jgi:homoserine dehydrogenase
MDPLGIALIGCGTVGSGVARLLLEQPERLAARAGRPLALRRVVVRDPAKPRAADIPRELFTTDLRAVLQDSGIHVAVELAGGVDWAKRAVLDLLAAGKHVVTANKALLAEHGTEVFDCARKHERAVAFEASVMGGVPVVAVLAESLTANQVLSLQGILNGTSNFILTGMSEFGRSYTEVLADAQARGYAEADPTLDVDGTDAAHKLAILAQLAFGVRVPVQAIDRCGIAGMSQVDIGFARELGYTIKLLAEAWLDTCPLPPGGVGPGWGGGIGHTEPEAATLQPGGREPKMHLALHVSPVLLRHQTLLAQVRGAYNAIRIQGDAAGEIALYGRGAGALPTASAVVADIIDLAVGRAQRTFQTLRLWSADRSDVTLAGRHGPQSLLLAPAGGRPPRRHGRSHAHAGRQLHQHRLGRAARSARRPRGGHGAAGNHDAHGADRAIPGRGDPSKSPAQCDGAERILSRSRLRLPLRFSTSQAR